MGNAAIEHCPRVPLAPVLVVEDDRVASGVICNALSDAGLVNPVHPVGSVCEARVWLERQAGAAEPSPALILLDIHLPGGSGLDVLRWLRKQPSLERTPVIMLSSSSEMDEINEAYDLGIASYLVKPVGLCALGDILRSLELPWALVAESDQPESKPGSAAPGA